MPLASLAADAVVLVHLAFVLFVVLGGLFAFRWPRVAWLHVPVAVYGAAIELIGWVCPLTPLENRLRRSAGEAGYGSGFIDHYLMPILYPTGLTENLQNTLGVLVLVLNVAIYSGVFLYRRKAHR